jgi:hypothetical protein
LQGKNEFVITIAGNGWRTGCVASSLSYEINSPSRHHHHRHHHHNTEYQHGLLSFPDDAKKQIAINDAFLE